MLRMRVIFPLLLILCSALATEEIISQNQVEAGAPSEDEAAEGRACVGCGVGGTEGRACGGCGGGGTVTKHTQVKPDITDLLKPDITNLLGGYDLLTLIISGVGSIAVVIFNILGIVLLALLLKSLLSDNSGPAATDPYYYASPNSYADPLSYNKRSSVGSSSTWSLQSLQDSPVMMFLTQFATDAFEKYNAIEKQ